MAEQTLPKLPSIEVGEGPAARKLRALRSRGVQTNVYELEKKGISTVCKMHGIAPKDLDVKGSLLTYRRREQDTPRAGVNSAEFIFNERTKSVLPGATTSADPWGRLKHCADLFSGGAIPPQG